MKREWKPGDVAMVTIAGESVRAVAVDKEDVGPIWQVFGHSFFKSLSRDNAHYIDDARPLVVIDPEEIPHLSDFATNDPPAALQAIADDVRDVGKGDLDATEQIIRWLADLMSKPPKPAEPTGLGAVVEDADGIRYVRTPQRDGVVWRGTGHWVYKDWVTIDAVRVLSEGVTP